MIENSTVIILFGGQNSERLVSVASAQHVADVLIGSRCWFWTLSGEILEVDRGELLRHTRPFENEFEVHALARWSDCQRALDAAPEGATLVLALHGVGSEDGQLQRWLEMRHLRFTGSGSDAAQCAFDKARAKRLVMAHGIRVADSDLVSGGDVEAAKRALLRLCRAGRAVLKPVSDGSSHSVYFVDDDAASLQAALDFPARPLEIPASMRRPAVSSTQFVPTLLLAPLAGSDSDYALRLGSSTRLPFALFEGPLPGAGA